MSGSNNPQSLQAMLNQIHAIKSTYIPPNSLSNLILQLDEFMKVCSQYYENPLEQFPEYEAFLKNIFKILAFLQGTAKQKIFQYQEKFLAEINAFQNSGNQLVKRLSDSISNDSRHAQNLKIIGLTSIIIGAIMAITIGLSLSFLYGLDATSTTLWLSQSIGYMVEIAGGMLMYKSVDFECRAEEQEKIIKPLRSSLAVFKTTQAQRDNMPDSLDKGPAID